jgi:lipoprotein-anchoring transpeptidase ErfK/SrfK
MLRHKLFAALLALSVLVAVATSARAQQATVTNQDLGVQITNSARVPGTVTTAPIINSGWKGITCTYNQTEHANTPATTISIQAFDAASSTWFTLVTSGSIANDATPTPISVYPGQQTASLPAGMVASGLHLPYKFRVSQTMAGASATITGTVGCNALH